jgi:hypothetical protein
VSTGHQRSVIRASTDHHQSVNRASTILGDAGLLIQGLCYGIYPKSTYWQPLCAKVKATQSQPQSENERQQSINDFGCCILCHPRAVVRLLSIMKELAAFLGNMVNIDVASPNIERQQSGNRASSQRQRASTILGVASYRIQELCYGIYPNSTYW